MQTEAGGKNPSVLFSSFFWDAGVMFEKILEGLYFGKAGIKRLQQTILFSLSLPSPWEISCIAKSTVTQKVVAQNIS